MKIFEGHKKKFSQLKINNDLWNSSLYLNHIKSKILKKNKKKDININYLFSILGILSKFNKKQKIIVLDYGGGAGVSYNKNFLIKNKNQIIYIYDNLKLIKLGKKYQKKNNVRFISEIRFLPKKIDILFLGSVLQYIEQPKKLFDKLVKFCPKFIVLEDVFALENDEFVTYENFSGLKIKFKFHNLKKLFHLFNNLNYKLFFKMPYIPIIKGKYKFYDMSNLPKKYQKFYTYNLVFVNK